ncbi:hypothetical protein AJ87_42875 [Rhizobium yanglingense]|nr:hypothetical protein AJ87_42875 [Rhizobium yanglingense]
MPYGPRAELGLDENTRLIGFFATLIDRKRPIRFVEAIHAFCAQHPELTIAGLLFGSPKHHGHDSMLRLQHVRASWA